MQQRSRPVRKRNFLKYAMAAAVMAASITMAVYAAPGAGQESIEFIVNQGLGMGMDRTDGSYYPMNLLAAERNTGFFVRIEPQMLQEEGGAPLLLISNDAGIWYFEDSEYLKEYGLLSFDTSAKKVWDAGQYDVQIDFPYGNRLEEEIIFREMKDIEIRIVPIDGFYSGAVKKAGEFDSSLCAYTSKVYPVGVNDLKWNIDSGEKIAFEESKYDLNTSIGRLRVWKYLKELREENGSDMVIGIVAENMKKEPSAKEAAVTGFTFGDDVSVISLEDGCPSVTIAHEIGHCLFLGDEYENGTFSVSMNMVPYQMKGKNRFSLLETAEGTNPYIIGGTADAAQGSGTIVYAEQYPYDIFSGELIAHDMTSFMGLSGYPEQEYWVTAQIWEAVYQELAETD